jgi:hypothetical protein
MHVPFKIHSRNNLIDKKDSYLIPRPPSWDDRNYSYGHQLYPSEWLSLVWIPVSKGTYILHLSYKVSNYDFFYPGKCISYIISNEIFQVYAYLIHCSNDRRGRDRMVVGFTTTYAQGFIYDTRYNILYFQIRAPGSMPITTKVVSLNPAHGEMYSIQHYVIKFVSNLRQVGGFLRVLWFPPPLIHCSTKRQRSGINEM